MKTLRLTRLLALLWGNVLVVHGQTAPSLPLPSIDDNQSQRWAVKFAPLSLFDPDNTIQFGIERLFGQHNAVQLELGYGFQGMNLWQSSQSQRYSDREIWRGRTEWRYYLNRTDQPRGKYIAVEGFYKQVDAHESGTIGIGCAAGPCQYYQLVSSPIYKYAWGGHVKFGRQFALSANNRLLADVYLGLGFRRRIIDRFQPPADSYYYRPSGFFLFDSFSPTPYALISVSYGVKIGYSF